VKIPFVVVVEYPFESVTVTAGMFANVDESLKVNVTG
jgi:hypothetical protein